MTYKNHCCIIEWELYHLFNNSYSKFIKFTKWEIENEKDKEKRKAKGKPNR
jgi:hypothetical protein